MYGFVFSIIPNYAPAEISRGTSAGPLMTIFSAHTDTHTLPGMCLLIHAGIKVKSC